MRPLSPMPSSPAGPPARHRHPVLGRVAFAVGICLLVLGALLLAGALAVALDLRRSRPDEGWFGALLFVFGGTILGLLTLILGLALLRRLGVSRYRRLIVITQRCAILMLLLACGLFSSLLPVLLLAALSCVGLVFFWCCKSSSDNPSSKGGIDPTQ